MWRTGHASRSWRHAAHVEHNSAETSSPSDKDLSADRFLFRSQSKASGRIYSKEPTVERPTDEMIKRLTTPEVLEAGNARPSLSVRVKIVVGIDGHVQSASPIDPLTKQSGLMAANKAKSFSFLPLRVDGKPVQVVTELTVKVEALPRLAALFKPYPRTFNSQP